jgi:hypothetical protein
MRLLLDPGLKKRMFLFSQRYAKHWIPCWRVSLISPRKCDDNHQLVQKSIGNMELS